MAVFLRLLSTEHCSLCDEALSMLFSMPDIAGLELQVKDVVSDDGLLEAYGERVPVLQLITGSNSTGADSSEDESAVNPGLGERVVMELNWPFSAQSVSRELRKLPVEDA